MEKLNLRLNHPCAFDWHELEAGSDKRHCGACAKSVIDFRNYNDTELYDFFKNKPSNICGFFTDSQLDKNIKPFKNRVLIPSLRYAASALLLFGFFIPGRANANDLNGIQTVKPSNTIKIKGLILLEGTRKPAAFSTVTIQIGKTLLYQFSTDAEGKYDLEIDSALIPKSMHVIILSNDKRVQYEEDVLKSELLAFFNRAIPFYENVAIVETTKTDTNFSDNSMKEKKKQGWNPFSRKPKRKYYRHYGGCPEF